MERGQGRWHSVGSSGCSFSLECCGEGRTSWPGSSLWIQDLAGQAGKKVRVEDEAGWGCGSSLTGGQHRDQWA